MELKKKYPTIEEMIKKNLSNEEDSETLKLMDSLKGIKNGDISPKKNF